MSLGVGAVACGERWSVDQCELISLVVWSVGTMARAKIMQLLRDNLTLWTSEDEGAEG